MASMRHQQRRPIQQNISTPMALAPRVQHLVNDASHSKTKEHVSHVKGSEIFIGGLARYVSEDMIKEMFSPYGEILELRMMKDQNGISKGFCFVRFSTKEASLRAQKERNGFMLNGKKIGVEPSSDRDRLFFGNLHKGWSAEEFDNLVRKAFQDVVHVDLAMSSINPSPGNRQLNRGFGFVRFSSHAAAARAHRVGSSSEFLLAGNCHPAIDWAEQEPELDPEEFAKIKVAFVGNLPANVDEEYLKELFRPFGKVEKVALSRKGQFPVGFVHFSERSDLDKAMKGLDGKMVTGPHGGSRFKIQVSVARPIEKERKRIHEEAKSNLFSKLTSYNSSMSTHDDSPLHDRKTKVPRLTKEPDGADPYEAAVISLPSTLKERFLHILTHGIATRYDIDICCIDALKELPESAALAVLDQFILSGSSKRDKGEYFNSLIAKHQTAKLESNWRLTHRPAPVDLRASLPAGSSVVRYISYSSSPGPYSPDFDDAPPPRIATVKSGERGTAYYTSSGAYNVGSRLVSHLSPPHRILEDEPPRSVISRLGEKGATYHMAASSGGHGTDTKLVSQLSPSHRVVERPQMKFDPYTGRPFKFDPFTGEPICPQSTSRYPASMKYGGV